MKLTEARKQTFLEELAKHGIIARAARAASPHSTVRDGAVRTFRDERQRDPDFAAAWDEAMELARGGVEAEVVRRGIEGYLEPVYQRGEQVGTVRRYDSRLLELHAKRLIPEYRDKASLDVQLRAEVRARFEIEIRAELLAEQEMGLKDTLRALSREDRGVLRAILERASAAPQPPVGPERADRLAHARERHMRRLQAAGQGAEPS